MTRFFFPGLLLWLCLGTLGAQASFLSYGVPCPTTQAKLQVSGLPKLGTSFTVSGIRFPSMCTRKFCSCACCDCNTCMGSLLVFGVSRVKLRLPGSQCDLLASPNLVLMGQTSGSIVVPVPNNAILLGGRFAMQRLDLSMKEVRGTQCQTSYRLLGIRGASDGVEGVVGR